MKLAFIIDGFGKKTEHEISTNEILTIGRTENSNIKLNDPKISTKHCSLELKSDAFIVHDTGSKNGTYLNEIKIINSKFFIGDTLKVGDYKITISPEKTDPNLHLILTGSEVSRKHSPRLVMDEKLKESLIENPLKRITANQNSLLSKEEILKTYRSLHLKSILFSILLFTITGYIAYLIAPYLNISKPLHGIILSEIFCLGNLYYFGFRKPKFNLAEKLAGVQEKYENQNL